MLRNVFLDEGGYWGLSCLPYLYTPQSASIDLIYITNLEMNVSNFGQYGHNLWNADRLFVEKSRYGWSHLAAAAISLNNIGSAILDQLKLEASADHIVADQNTGELTVINSTNVHLISSAHSTVTIDTTPKRIRCNTFAAGLLTYSEENLILRLMFTGRVCSFTALRIQSVRTTQSRH